MSKQTSNVHQTRKETAIMGWVARIIAATAIAVLSVGAMMLVSARPVTKSGVITDAAETRPEPTSSAPEEERGFLGVVVAGEVVDVAARAEGLVTDVRVRLGDQLSRNDVIATLDDRPLRDELAVAQATLQSARSESEHARVELAEARERLERWQGLAATDVGLAVVSQEELSALRYKEQYALRKQQGAQARVAEQQARIKSFLRRIDDAVVRAPFDGQVATRYVNAGATVSHGEPIVRLTREGELWVRFAVPDERGDEARLDASVEVRVDSLETPLAGVIEKLAPEVDPASRMIFAEARLVVPEALASLPMAGRVVRVYVKIH